MKNKINSTTKSVPSTKGAKIISNEGGSLKKGSSSMTNKIPSKGK